ncbi:MAG: ABC transporter permease [Eubacteriales bacterium]|nr:ABC transporter permease [Eubacteriales bacterium]
MLNYMKSEWYRLTHGKEIYVMTAVMSGLVLAMNIVLALGNRYIPDFRYGTFRFSLNIFTSASYYMLVIAAFVGAYLYADDIKNGVMKNAIAYGIPRVRILLGKCIISFIFSLLMLIAIFVVYVGSAYLLLKEPEILPLVEMVKAILSALPSAAAALIFMIVLKTICAKDIVAVLWWAVVFYIIPTVCFFVGLKIEFAEKISEWMPYVFLQMKNLVTYSDYNCLWDTAEGLTRCILGGIAWILVVLAFGLRKAGRQEY